MAQTYDEFLKWQACNLLLDDGFHAEQEKYDIGYNKKKYERTTN